MKNKTQSESRKRYSFDILDNLSNKALLVISIILSVVCWIVITLYVSADSKTVVSDVPIIINTQDIEEVHGLQVISYIGPEELTDAKVDVEVRGSIYDISRITAEDITITAAVSRVTSPGEYALSLAASCSERNVNVSIKDGHSYIRVWFDRIQQQRLTVDNVIVNGASTTSEKLILGDYYSALKSITVQGPESVVETVAAVHLTADVDHALSTTEEIPAVINYIDEEGNRVEKNIEWLNIIDYNDLGGAEGGGMAGEPNADVLTVTVPIRKKAELAIEVPIKNVPEGFDAATLKYKTNPEKIMLEGDIDAIDKLIAAGSYKLEAIDLSSLSVKDRAFTLPLNLTTGVEELNGVSEVSVVFEISPYATKKFTVENNGAFKVINNEGVNVEIISDSIEFIVIGPKKQVEKLKVSSFEVAVDLKNYDGTGGQRKLPAVVRIKDNNGCWINGAYTLMTVIEGGAEAAD